MDREESTDQVESSVRPCSVSSDSVVQCLQWNNNSSVLRNKLELFYIILGNDVPKVCLNIYSNAKLRTEMDIKE